MKNEQKHMTQLQHFYAAHRRIADVNETFLELVRGTKVTPGLTREELARNIENNPALWGRFSNWLDKLPSIPRAQSRTAIPAGY